MQDFSWELRITTATRDTARVFARRHQFEVGRPLNFDRDYRRVSALEYALGALGGELVTGLQQVARLRQVVVDNVEAILHGSLNNPLTHIGVVGEKGHPGIERIVVQVYVESPEPIDQLEEVWSETLEKSPLVQTLRHCVNLELGFKRI